MTLGISILLQRKEIMSYPESKVGFLLKAYLPVIFDLGVIIASLTIASLTMQNKMFTSTKTLAASCFFVAAPLIFFFDVIMSRPRKNVTLHEFYEHLQSPFDPDEGILPPGWRYIENNGEPFYWHDEREESTWERPTE